MGPKNAPPSPDRGFHFIGPGNFGYDAALAAAGRNPADYKVASMQVIHVSDSTEKAWDDAAAGIEYFVNFYNMRLDLDGQPQGNAYITEEMIRGGNAGFWSAAVGTPDDVIKALTPFASGQLGRITELACGFRHAGMRTDVVHHSMRLFHDHVLPALQEIAAKG
jgi:alkanesulfonate monooxygenase SsuD/methylene tetrahydromethanopterin reductase-like flavin-dependent oxidoreductase (luciferase family)